MIQKENEIYKPYIEDMKRLEKLIELKKQLNSLSDKEMQYLIADWTDTSEKYIQLFNINTILLNNFVIMQNKQSHYLKQQNLSKTYIWLESLNNKKDISFMQVLTYIDGLCDIYLNKNEKQLSPPIASRSLANIRGVMWSLGTIDNPSNFDNQIKYNELYEWFFRKSGDKK